MNVFTHTVVYSYTTAMLIVALLTNKNAIVTTFVSYNNNNEGIKLVLLFTAPHRRCSNFSVTTSAKKFGP